MRSDGRAPGIATASAPHATCRAEPPGGTIEVVGVRHTALALAFLAAGCTSPAVTQLIVVVDTDLRMPSEIDHLSIAVTGPSRMSIEQEAPLTGTEALPFTLTVVPSGEALGPVEIVVSATLGASATPVVARTATVTLVRGETRVVLLHLARSCVGVLCTARGQTCTENGCAPADRTPLYPWSGTPPRLGDDAGPSIDAGHDAGPVDAGPRDAAFDAPIELDGGPDCTALGCDDTNPCTDDVCSPTTRSCEHRPLDIACDDGSFCNGFDRCGAGSCSVHVGNPCLGSTVCDETRNGCTGCTADTDCPAPMMAEWGECTGFSDACGNGGSHARIVRTFACMGDICVGTDRAEAGSCSIDRTGASCMPTTCGGFGACGEGPGGTCGTTGMASRTCTDHTCQAGACAAASRTETTTCARATDGLGCGMASCEGWSGCANDGSCSTSGTHSRRCTTPTCMGGSCADVTSDESEGCFASTDGSSCGAPSCDGWSACSFADACTTSGNRSRTCYGPTCSGGSCSSGAYTENEACGRATDGMACGGGPTCGGWACTGGLSDYECDQDGFEQRTCQDPVCSGGACGLSAPRTETGAPCTVNIDGSPCSGGGCFGCYGGACYFLC